MSEGEALRNALDDPDNPPQTDAELAKAVRARGIPGETAAQKLGNLKVKRYKKLVSTRYDAAVLDYFIALTQLHCEHAIILEAQKKMSSIAKFFERIAPCPNY